MADANDNPSTCETNMNTNELLPLGPRMLSFMTAAISDAIEICKAARTVEDKQECVDSLRELCFEVSSRTTAACVTGEQIKAANAVLAAGEDEVARQAEQIIIMLDAAEYPLRSASGFSGVPMDGTSFQIVMANAL